MSDTTLVSSPPTLDDLRARREEILALAAQYGATNIRVFGSVARGEATPNSDVDFLVDFSHHSLLNPSGLSAALKELLGRSVDVSLEETLLERYRTSILRDSVPL